MRTLIRLAFACSLFSLPALAQLDVHIQIPVPTLRFEAAPQLVVVEPGIQVVPDYAEEVFFCSGFYWHRAGDHWFRARDYRGGWVVVDHKRVPPGLFRIPRGKYKQWKRERREERREDRRDEGHGHGGGHGKHH